MPSRRIPLTAVFGAALAVGCGEEARNTSGSSSPSAFSLIAGSARAQRDPNRDFERAWAAVQPHLRTAARADAQAVGRAISHVRALVVGRKKHARRFANELLSLGGKLDYLLDSDRAYRLKLTRTFEREVLSTEDVQQELAATTQRFVQDLAAHDNALLVAARTDVADLDVPAVPRALPSTDVLGPHSRRITRNVGDATTTEVVGLGATELVVGAVVSRVMAGTAARTALGGAAGAATLGASIGIMFVADVVISEFDDSDEEIAREVSASLDELATAVTLGDRQRPGLRPILEAMARDRQALRERTIRDALRRDG